MADKVDAENIQNFKKEQQEFEYFTKEFDKKREEIIQTNEEIKKN